MCACFVVTGAVTVAVTVAAVAAGVTVGAAASAVADAVLYPWRAAKGLAGALTDGAGVGLTCEARTGDGCMAGHYSSADALTRIPSPLRPPHTGRLMGQILCPHCASRLFIFFFRRGCV